MRGFRQQPAASSLPLREALVLRTPMLLLGLGLLIAIDAIEMGNPLAATPLAGLALLALATAVLSFQIAGSRR
ncbi:hypothetical protein [Haloarcula nitratireducens]|uniref:Uncharacterized protein n=1 Tax=Haloarcula nitratireducens TaxID=2487749 RepID=A0AAW4PAY4_9EURY|nr:hypothetical protein [Halomicroarcula nitratireducens]MBX0294968.1 hypothetical protein [Halomicroarcula nitratireducens]